MDGLFKPVSRGLFSLCVPQPRGLIIPSDGLEAVMPRPATDIASPMATPATVLP